MSLQERTLVVKNIDGDQLTNELLEELFSNFGPVLKVVLRKDHSFIEYTSKESVAYAWAMTEGIILQNRQLRVAPKLDDDPFYYAYRDRLKAFENQLTTSATYIDAFLSAEQLHEKNQLIEKLNSNPSDVSSLRKRLRRYERHYEAPRTFNLILKRDLSNREFNRGFGRRSRSRSPNRNRSHSSDNRNADFQRRAPNYYQSEPDLRETLNARNNRHSFGQTNFRDRGHGRGGNYQHNRNEPRRHSNEYDSHHRDHHRQQRDRTYR